MQPRTILAILFVAMVLLSMTGSGLAQEDGDACLSCRTNNFYYVLIGAIIICAIFLYWANRNRIGKRPMEPKEKEPQDE